MLLVVALNFGDSGGLSVLLVWDMIVAAVGYCVYSRLPPGGGCVFRQGLSLVSRMVACRVIAGLQVALLGVQCVALGVSLWPGGLFLNLCTAPATRDGTACGQWEADILGLRLASITVAGCGRPHARLLGSALLRMPPPLTNCGAQCF